MAPGARAPARVVVPGCPHAGPAVDAVGRAAAQAGIAGCRVRVTVVGGDVDAGQPGFAGSSTFRIDGVDPFPGSGASAGAACRLYRTPGGLAGVPELSRLRDALIAASAGTAR